MIQLIEGSEYFFYDKMIAPVLLTSSGLLQPRKAIHAVGLRDTRSCMPAGSKI